MPLLSDVQYPDVKKNKEHVLDVINEADDFIWKPSLQSWFGLVVVHMHALVCTGCGECHHCPAPSTPTWTENKGQILLLAR